MVVPVPTNDPEVDQDLLSIMRVTLPTQGTVSINADGTLSYTAKQKVGRWGRIRLRTPSLMGRGVSQEEL